MKQAKKCKFLFICGAIASGIGKGVMNSSMGLLLKQYGYSVSFLKIDPYLNIDAGTMNPYEHGEVFVTNDGGEVDLDLGNYERFIDMNLSFMHSLTTGKLYQQILEKERRGQYLGQTVQIIPHVVNEIKSWIRNVAQVKVDNEQETSPDILLVEIGGTVGDMESIQYYEAARQMFIEDGQENVSLIMLTHILTLGENEQKTKPAQNGIKDLRITGLHADFLVCRSKFPLQEGPKKKLALFGSLSPENVFSVPDVEHIYQVPKLLESQGLVQKILQRLQLLPIKKPEMEVYYNFPEFHKQLKQQKQYKIGIFGKYMKNKDAYMSLFKALYEASYEVQENIQLVDVDLVDIEQTKNYELFEEKCKEVDGILIPGGFGQSGFEAKIKSAQYARENKKPFLGICYGFQGAVLEYARNVLGCKKAYTEELASEEFQMENPNDAFIISMPEIDKRYLGGNMRLGNRFTIIKDEKSLAYQIYNQIKISERHRHRYEVNPHKIKELEEAGLSFSGKDEFGVRMEILELPRTVHPFYCGVQYHPEFTSKNFKANSLFVKYILAVCGKNINDPIPGLKKKLSSQ